MTSSTGIRVFHWWALVAIAGFGVWLRASNLATYPTWWDEYASVFSASGQIASQGTKYGGRVSQAESGDVKILAFGKGGSFQAAEVLARNRIVNVPAASLFWDRGNGLAFSLLLHAWVLIFGFSDAALRALPCVLGALAIPAVFAVGTRATKLPGVGLIAALLVACNALLVQFSQEVRPYSLAVLLGLLATWVFLGFFQDNLRRPALWGILYAALLIALGLTHYLAIPTLVGAHFIGALIALPRLRTLGLWTGGVAALSMALAVWMVWGGYLGLQTMGEHDQVWMQRATSGMFWWLTPFDWRTGIRLCIERTVQFNLPLFVFWPPQGLVSCGLLGVFLLAVLAGLLAMCRASGRVILAGTAIFCALSAGGLFSVYLSWKSGHTLPFIDRYFTFYIPFQSLLISLAVSGVTMLRARWAKILVSLILLSGSADLIFANVSEARNAKEKEKFSFDVVVAGLGSKLPPEARARCDSLDSALVLALKAAGKFPDLRLVIDPKAGSKALIEMNNPKIESPKP